MTTTPATTTSTADSTPRVRLLTADRFLAAYITALHPAVSITTPDRDPAVGVILDKLAALAHLAEALLPPTDGLLLFAGGGCDRRSVYLGWDLDDAGIWSRAVAVHAETVAMLPDGEDWLRTELHTHLGTHDYSDRHATAWAGDRHDRPVPRRAGAGRSPSPRSVTPVRLGRDRPARGSHPPGQLLTSTDLTSAARSRPPSPPNRQVTPAHRHVRAPSPGRRSTAQVQDGAGPRECGGRPMRCRLRRR